ncbi:MAG: hypothetical protein KFH98_08620, partial [Gemmatimonadetes bacterium]|nr:hypothetical protein [Gemmatimonadota bacterium]
LAVLATGCADGPAAPDQDQVDFELASFDVMGDGYGYGSDGMGVTGGVHRGPRDVPVLGRLLVQARATVVAEQGREAAQAMFATLDALRREAHAARRAGDRELFREKIEAAHAEAARLIVEILGASRAQELIDVARARLAVLDEVIAGRQAAGQPVARLEQASVRAGELITAAESSLASGEVIRAMIQASRAAQLAHVAAHHGARQGRG